MLEPVTILAITSASIGGAIALGFAGYFIYRKLKIWYKIWRLRPVGPIRCDTPVWPGEIYYPKKEDEAQK